MEPGKNEARIWSWGYVNVMLADLLLRVCMTMQGTIVPLYMLERGFSPAVAGLTTTAFMVVALSFRPASGKLVDSLSRYLVVLIGAAVYMLASGFFLFQIPAWLFLTARGFQGFGFCFYGTAVMTLATDIIPKSRMSEGIGYLGLTRTIAGAFPPILALALKDTYGYQVTFTVTFVLAVITLLAGFTLNIGQKKVQITDQAPETNLENVSPPARSQREEALWEKLVDKDALKPSIFMMLIMFVISSVGTFLVAYAVGKGISNPGIFFTVNAVAIAVGRLAVGKVSQKFGSVTVIVPGIALTGLSMLGMYSSANLTVLILAGILYGLGMGMVQPELNSLAILATRDERRGLANSTFFMAMDLGMAVGAYAMGILANYAGLGSTFLAGAMLMGLTLLLYLFLEQKGLLRASRLSQVN